MLVLSRKLSQQILIGSDITITVARIEGNHVRLGIEAPAGVSVLRDELVVPPDADRSRPGATVARQGVRAVYVTDRSQGVRPTATAAQIGTA